MKVEPTGRDSPVRRLPERREKLLQRLRRWLRPESGADRYLAAAIDHADLERRIRDVDRANSGPVFMTFNH